MGKWWKISVVVFTMVLLSAAVTTPNADAVLVSVEDFEGGASGWTNNTTTAGSPAFTRFLGVFPGTGGSQAISKVYPLSGLQAGVLFRFDFYEIDAWNNNLFNVFIDDLPISSNAFSSNIYDTPAGAVNLLPPPSTLGNLGFGIFPDQTYRYSFVYPTTGTAVKLGFGTTLAPGTPAGWGIDNVLVFDNLQPGSPVIPEPSSMLLLGTGLFGAFMRKRRLSVL